jgi:hypothetical protein
MGMSLSIQIGGWQKRPHRPRLILEAAAFKRMGFRQQADDVDTYFSEP